MRRFQTPVFVFLVLLCGPVWNESYLGHAAVQESTPVESSEYSRDLEALIRVLQDPEQAKKLADRLTPLLDEPQESREPPAPAAVPPPPSRQAPSVTFRLLEAAESLRAQVEENYKRLQSRILEVMNLTREIRLALQKKETWPTLLSFGLQLALALFAGLLLLAVLRRATKRWERKHLEELSARGEKVARLVQSTLLRLYPWLCVYLAFSLFFAFVRGHDRFRTVLLELLLLFGGYQVFKHFLANLISPEAPEIRLPPLGDQTAAYLFVWGRRFLLYAFWILLFLLPAAACGQRTFASFLAAVLKIGLVVMAAIFAAQWKEPIAEKLQIPIREEDGPWIRRLKGASNQAAGKLYLVFVLFLFALLGLSLLGFRRAFLYALTAAAKTLLVLAAAALASLLWRAVFRRLFDVGAAIRTKFPDLELQVNRYTRLLGNGGYALIGLVAGMSVLEAWGVDIRELLLSNAPLLRSIVRIPLIVLLAVLLIQIGSFLITLVEKEVVLRSRGNHAASAVEAEKRANTLGRICRNALWAVVTATAAMMVLSELGIDVKPFLAGAGIVGLAVGFGAQNLVRDVITGMFFILEDRIRVGDVVILNGTGGLVEQVNLRTTVLRGLDGVLHVFPNGAISTMSNMTYQYSYYVFDVGVAYKENVDRVMAVLKSVGDEIMKDPDYSPFILEPLEILGVDKFADSAVVIKARVKTAPIKQWFVGREMNRRIKNRFDAEGIEIPFPHRTLYFGEGQNPLALLGGRKVLREEIREMVREALSEIPGRPPSKGPTQETGQQNPGL